MRVLTGSPLRLITMPGTGLFVSPRFFNQICCAKLVADQSHEKKMEKKLVCPHTQRAVIGHQLIKLNPKVGVIEEIRHGFPV